MIDNLNQHWNQSTKVSSSTESMENLWVLLNNYQGGLPVSIMEVN